MATNAPAGDGHGEVSLAPTGSNGSAIMVVSSALADLLKRLHKDTGLAGIMVFLFLR